MALVNRAQSGGGIEPFTKWVHTETLTGGTTKTVQLERLPAVVVFNTNMSSSRAWACYVHTDGTISNIIAYPPAYGYVQSVDVANKTITIRLESDLGTVYVQVMG